MTFQHKELATNGRWNQLSFVEQMANVGSEVCRALNWQEKGNAAYAELAYFRALELLCFTLDDPRNLSRSKEIARVKEALVDTFDGTNEYASTPTLWRNYFNAFAYAARRDR
jgi:hypothetical protein